MPNLSGNILIVEARFYEDIADALVCGAETTLEKADQRIERIAVPGVFEIPTAIKFAWDDIRFDGCVTLGCVIRGETDHYEHICREVSRALMDLSIELKMPHGFGIITCENLEQAWERANIKQKNIGARAANACLQMIKIRATNSG
jgi:6,7-dimethyl-8-ribityllumazine synthase